jgi:hypothetical protein
MNEAQVRSLEQVRHMLEGTQSLEFRRAEDDQGRYAWSESVLRRFDYRRLPCAHRGPVLAYLQRLSGYSRAQITRLMSRRGAGKHVVKDGCPVRSKRPGPRACPVRDSHVRHAWAVLSTQCAGRSRLQRPHQALAAALIGRSRARKRVFEFPILRLHRRSARSPNGALIGCVAGRRITVVPRWWLTCRGDTRFAEPCLQD